MGSFNRAVELRGTWLDIGVTDAVVFYMPLELGLKLVTVVSSDLTNAEGELFDDMVDEGDSAGLRLGLGKSET